jgi:dTDP-4-dehydrorhamnose reductase
LILRAKPTGRILITGGSGQVGEALTRTLAPLGEVFTPGRDELDLGDAKSIRKVMREFRPRWVVNAGAYTAVDNAESEPEAAFAINATAPEIFAEEVRDIGSVLVHFSTDYVFDGSKTTAYVESDPTNPLNVYGSSKLAGERALAASGVAHFIFRTSWVYGATGKNFLLTILKLAREREHLRIVGDQHGAPTWSYDLARMTAHVIEYFEQLAGESKSSLSEVTGSASGIYHASGAGETTWCGFAAHAVAELQTLEPETKLATLEAISTAEYPTPAKRPLNSRLDCLKLADVLGWRMPDWRESLSPVVANLARQANRSV